jgi:hypothetical protein
MFYKVEHYAKSDLGPFNGIEEGLSHAGCATARIVEITREEANEMLPNIPGSKPEDCPVLTEERFVAFATN